VSPATTPENVPFSAEVAEYLADCAEYAQLLSSAYHPTEGGALKVIWHRGEDQEEQIREAFRAATVAPPSARRARRTGDASPVPAAVPGAASPALPPGGSP
jgi:hypothetical protein